MKPVLIDCDPGIDDSVAIAFAMGSGKLALRAITTVSGNLTADRCADNAARVLDRFGAPKITIARGPLKPLVRPYPRDPFSHGDDGLGELRLAPSARAIDPRFAPDVIVEAANAEGGELTILALGPLTNIALALTKDPELPKKVKELIIIGGAFGFGSFGATRATGDNPASEWNIYVDPEAADIVFNAGFNLTALGLDVLTLPSIELGPQDRRTLEAAATPQAEFLLGVVGFVERRGFKSYCGLMDSIAVAVAIDPDIITREAVQVAVETQSALSLGQTIVDRRDNFRWTHLPTINAASTVDAKRFFGLLVPSLCRQLALMPSQ